MAVATIISVKKKTSTIRKVDRHVFICAARASLSPISSGTTLCFAPDAHQPLPFASIPEFRRTCQLEYLVYDNQQLPCFHRPHNQTPDFQTFPTKLERLNAQETWLKLFELTYRLDRRESEKASQRQDQAVLLASKSGIPGTAELLANQ